MSVEIWETASFVIGASVLMAVAGLVEHLSPGVNFDGFLVAIGAGFGGVAAFGKAASAKKSQGGAE